VETDRVRGRSPVRRLDFADCAILAGFTFYLTALAAGVGWLLMAPHGATFHLLGRTLGSDDIIHRLLRRGLVIGLLLPSACFCRA
jgi:hypothetical protein